MIKNTNSTSAIIIIYGHEATGIKYTLSGHVSPPQNEKITHTVLEFYEGIMKNEAYMNILQDGVFGISFSAPFSHLDEYGVSYNYSDFYNTYRFLINKSELLFTGFLIRINNTYPDTI